MSVQLHYNGSVFTLDPTRDDDFWARMLADMYRRADDEGPVFAHFDLDDGRTVVLRLHATTSIALVTSVLDGLTETG